MLPVILIVNVMLEKLLEFGQYAREIISLATTCLNILIDACFVLICDQALLFVNNNDDDDDDDDEDGDDVMRMTMTMTSMMMMMTMILHGRI